LNRLRKTSAAANDAASEINTSLMNVLNGKFALEIGANITFESL
jgi:hypothetical protein